MAQELIIDYDAGEFKTKNGEVVGIDTLELKLVRTSFSQKVKTGPYLAQDDPTYDQWDKEFQRCSTEFNFDYYRLAFEGHLNSGITIVTGNFYTRRRL